MKKDSFIDRLLEQITVSSSEIYRDTSLWSTIKEEVFSERSDYSEIWVWHAGYFTEDRVHSMVILLESSLIQKSKIVSSKH